MHGWCCELGVGVSFLVVGALSGGDRVLEPLVFESSLGKGSLRRRGLPRQNYVCTRLLSRVESLAAASSELTSCEAQARTDQFQAARRISRQGSPFSFICAVRSRTFSFCQSEHFVSLTNLRNFVEATDQAGIRTGCEQ